MSVTSIEKDMDSLSLTLVANFDAPVDRVWQLWADPRQLEQWWGPPSHPATVEQHELSPGGDVKYFMTGSEGEKFHGWWRISSVNAPKSIEFVDGFADANGNPVADLPTNTVRVEFAEVETGTQMQMRSQFESSEQMQQILDMGAAEGLQQAVGQIDDLLAK